MVSARRRAETIELESALGNGLFDGIHHEALVPFIVEGVLRPHDGFKGQFELILTGLANVAIFDVEIVPVLHGGLDGALTNVADEGLHDGLL
jgi:hypothetical protein